MSEMSIQKDAGELLVYVYNQYVQSVRWTTRENVKTETKWDTGRIDNAIEYLKDSELIKIILYLGDAKSDSYGFGITGLTPQGINIAENKQIFKSTFGFEIGIPGVFKFSWQGEKQ
jgi:hypothetical protein